MRLAVFGQKIPRLLSTLSGGSLSRRLTAQRQQMVRMVSITSPALAPGREREKMLVRITALPPSCAIVVSISTSGSELGGIIKAVPSSNLPPPNPSFERTRHGRPLQAFISFWALRALPRRASQLQR